MATKSKTKTKPAAKKADKTTAKSDTSKTETAKADASSSTNDTSDSSDNSATDSSAADSSATDSGTTDSGSGKSSASSRSISYFSSVSTDDYRSGWDGVFGNSGAPEKRKPAKRIAKATNRLPMTITLDWDELEAEVREQLEAVFRRHAKKKRLNFDKLSDNGQVSLQISCRISGG